ncbi:MAG: ferredoxin [Candidatus Moranbacteria bacterium]|nr:ferredoxin [Candidatus Moranbacteria bacterium]
MGVKKITICHKRNDCIGCGSCVLLSPHCFVMNRDDGKADLVDGVWKGKEFVVAKADEERFLESKHAADACPMGIIRV